MGDAVDRKQCRGVAEARRISRCPVSRLCSLQCYCVLCGLELLPVRRPRYTLVVFAILYISCPLESNSEYLRMLFLLVHGPLRSSSDFISRGSWPSLFLKDLRICLEMALFIIQVLFVLLIR